MKFGSLAVSFLWAKEKSNDLEDAFFEHVIRGATNHKMKSEMFIESKDVDKRYCSSVRNISLHTFYK